ncbi:MAG: beta-hexosaminidase [Lachnospiraceae bacterium]|nr:beta-hexosaminidase [Lachnospiraceae bacterium]
MKLVGKILLSIILAVMFFGILYVGVTVVIWDGAKAEPMSFESGLGEIMMKGHEESAHQAVSIALKKIEEITAKEREWNAYIDKLLESMTMEQKLAQMMILTNENDITQYNLTNYQPGGVILFEVDFAGKTIEQVRNRVDIMQSHMKIPLYVGVDEEGGQVSRLKTLAERDLPTFSGARELMGKGTDAVTEDTELKMQYLKQLGINLNFAPVADVVSNRQSYMYYRSAGDNKQVVSDYVKTVLSAMKDSGVSACVKHFPGYGNNVNTHNVMAKDDRALEEYENQDFVPFRTGIQNGVDMIMVSHIVMEQVDADNPASLSSSVHNLLRADLGFSGVVITDDLNMQAILRTMTIEEATGAAFVAGNDMVFSADFAASMKGAKAAVEQGKLSETQINESVRRILRMKIDNGVLMVEE